MFLSDADTKPFTLTSHDALWPVGLSLEEKMTMKQPRTLMTTDVGEFTASFVGKVKRLQQDEATEVLTKKRKNRMDEPAANIRTLR